MAFRKAPDFTPVLETKYDGRFPSLLDMLRQGGVPGVEYYLCSSAYIAQYQSQGLDMVSGLPAFEIHGPKGVASAFLMCMGVPIPGADPLNGVRKYSIDPTLCAATGIELESTDAERETQSGESDARVQTGNAPQLVRAKGDEPQASSGDRVVRATGVREAAPPEPA